MAKYVIIVPDGAADEPLEQLQGKPPLEAAGTRTIVSKGGLEPPRT